MQHSALAQRFEDVSRGLRAEGHGIIMRKARALLESGDTDGAMAFIENAGARMRRGELDELLAAVRIWAEAGGDVAKLVAEPMWTASRAREDQGVGIIREAIASGENLSDLVDALALERMAFNEKEAPASLPPMPERVELAPIEPAVAVEPAAPVEPAAAAEPETPAEPELPAEPEAPAAVVEKPADLESRAPDFDGPAEPDAPAEPGVPAASTDEPAEPEMASEPEAPVEPEVAAAEPEAPALGDKPVEPITEASPPATTEGGGTRMIVLLLVAAGLFAAWYFTR